MGPMRHGHAGVLDIGYYEAAPSEGQVVLLLHGYPYDIHMATLSSAAVGNCLRSVFSIDYVTYLCQDST